MEPLAHEGVAMTASQSVNGVSLGHRRTVRASGPQPGLKRGDFRPITQEMLQPVAIAHDFLTQRGGAERVVLELAQAFPGAEVWTSLYAPEATFPAFVDVPVRTSFLQAAPILRRRHRAAFPLLPAAFSRLRPRAEVVVCSSAGWAHGVGGGARKVVYCHTPARWLYHHTGYARELGAGASLAAAVLRRPMRRWDKHAAGGVARYVANSTVVQERIRRTYGRDADLVHPPVGVAVDGARRPVAGVEPGFVLSVSRLLPYKRVGVVAEAMRALPDRRLVVAGAGRSLDRLAADAPANVRFLGAVDDDELRWLYANAAVVATAADEDFGIVPVEAAAHGVPTVALGAGGHLDTVIDGETGCLFPEPTPAAVAAGLQRAFAEIWDTAHLVNHAEAFSPMRFRQRMAAIVDTELDLARSGAVPSEKHFA